jgi:predicted ATPase
LLYQADICAVLKHVRGAAMAEQVATAMLADVGHFTVFVTQLPT